MTMKSLVATVVVSLLALAHAVPVHEKIVGGVDTDIKEVPYQAALVTDGPFIHCGGSIIDEVTILTAGHCANTDYKVRVGVTNYSDTNNIYNVSKVIVHPEFDFPYNDVSIFKLATPLTFSDRVQPIKLAKKEPAANTPALASGWGRLSTGGDQPKILQSIVLPIATREWCDDSFHLDESVLCAGSEVVNEGTCNGDSGGPLVVNNELVGVVSFGSSLGCALGFVPSGFANVATLSTWIEKQLG